MNQFQRMSFNKELENELVDLAAAVNTNIRQVEDAFNKLELHANNFEVKRRGIVKEGTRHVMNILQAKERVSNVVTSWGKAQVILKVVTTPTQRQLNQSWV